MLQLVKTVPVFCGTQRFIFMFTTLHHLFLSWANLTQSMPPPLLSPSCLYTDHLMPKSHLFLCLPSVPFPSGFSTKTMHSLLLLLQLASHLPCPFVPDLITPIIFCRKCKFWSCTLCIRYMPNDINYILQNAVVWHCTDKHFYLQTNSLHIQNIYSIFSNMFLRSTAIFMP